MNKDELAAAVFKIMYGKDAFSKWLGIECIKMGPGFCSLRMKVRSEMTNGFEIAHGGITYSFADSALAFASNSHGRKSVSVETGISHTTSVKEGDVLLAIAEELSLSNKIGVYQVRVTTESGTVVALFKGTVYRTSKEWFPENKAF
jgi:acyl-CoA thioesterase